MELEGLLILQPVRLSLQDFGALLQPRVSSSTLAPLPQGSSAEGSEQSCFAQLCLKAKG